jgi:PAS domain S-box-containing protein
MAMGVQLNADNLQEVVVVCDDDGIILSWNKAGEDITGFSASDVLGYHVDTVVAEACREDLRKILGFQRSGSILPGLPMRLLTNYGMEVPADLTSFPLVVENKPAGWVLLFRDTTLKVQLQEALDRLDQLYRSLVERSPDLIYVLDDKARVIFINDTVEQLLGYSKKEILGHELIDIVHPDDRGRAYWPLRERRLAGRDTRSLSLRLLTRAGAPRRYDLDFIYISLDSVGLGNVHSGNRAAYVGTQGVARDVTDLVMLREFSEKVSMILPVCMICHRIQVITGDHEEWVALSEYVTRKTGTLFSHSYCPDHLPSIP